MKKERSARSGAGKGRRKGEMESFDRDGCGWGKRNGDGVSREARDFGERPLRQGGHADNRGAKGGKEGQVGKRRLSTDAF